MKEIFCLTLALLVAALGPVPAQAQSTRVAAASQAFWNAVRLDDVKALQTEMLRGASANARHPEYGPAIVTAARERSPKVVAYLAELRGTRIDAPNRHDETALMLVSLQGDLATARLLVARGAEINRQGWTPLHYAASGGHPTVVEFLLEAHAYIDAQSANGTTPLMMAARHKHTTVVRLLIEAGADPSLENDAGYDAARYMAAHGEAGEAQWLREQAQAFRKRYGSVEAPVPAAPPVPAAAPGPA
ncbi:MAG: ankyrin repeat domain-containing protein, partial [Burkholderiaceae bacterium]